MSDAVEYTLTKTSAGFQTRDDFKRKREEIEQEKALIALKQRVAGGVAAPVTSDAPSEPTKSKKKKKKLSSLSFGDDLEAEGEASPSLAPKKMGKCNDVDVSFLTKNPQEEQEAAVRQEAAMREVLRQQQVAKEESISLAYTFRSERTQRECPNAVLRGSVTVKRGQAAEEVAVAVRSDVERLGGKFAAASVQGIREERDVLLVCCCEGVAQGSFVVPGAVPLVELCARRWSDSSAALFDDFKHGIVVAERRWYEQQKHVYPYNQWRAYDSHAEYSLREFVVTRNSAVNPLDPQRHGKK